MDAFFNPAFSKVSPISVIVFFGNGVEMVKFSKPVVLKKKLNFQNAHDVM
jgi:hypothetical protein